MLMVLAIYGITAFILIHKGNLGESIALTWGAMVSLLLITPIGYGIIEVFDNTVDIIVQKGGE